MQKVEYYIARRYLLSKRKVRFINVISFISVTGITVGVAALLIVLAVFNGFQDVVTNVLVGFDPHIRVEQKGAMTTSQETEIERSLRAVPNLRGVSPYVSGKAMLVAKSYNDVVFIRGVDDKRIGEVSGLQADVLYGGLSLEDSSGENKIVIGLALADRLASVVGDEIQIISPAGFQTAFSGLSVPQTIKFRVSGIFESNNKDYDANYAYVSIPAAQRLFDLPNKFSGIEMRLDNFRNADDVKGDLVDRFPSTTYPGLSISSWYDLHRTLYFVMRMERWTAYILLCLIILVATFNMLGSLSMAVIEKRRDIGVLRALGLHGKGIINIFMLEGLLIGIAGTLFGFLLGLFVLYLQIHYQIFALDTNVFIIPAIPVKIEWGDFIVVALASMGLTFLAAFYPAYRAARTMPAESLRWE